MNSKEAFIKAGFNVVGTENNENKLLKFLKENYPFVIKDNEINIQELKAILGLPVDEKVNGYGLNFVGRNFARAKYAQKTDKELKLNKELSKNIDTTQNLVLKGDNLDCLKILKNHYSGKIKCIYIDPPYNTDSDEFVYPDKFDKEEAEVLGLQNLSVDDFARMEFAFKTKKSHNGWLAFMYPRLLLARDLLSDDGVIFISIDDNEQANLKLLCDEIFGEENLKGIIIRATGTTTGQDALKIGSSYDSCLCYAKTNQFLLKGIPLEGKDLNRFKYDDNDGKGKYALLQLRKTGNADRKEDREKMFYPITAPDGSQVFPIGPTGYLSRWRTGKDKFNKMNDDKLIVWKENDIDEEFDDEGNYFDDDNNNYKENEITDYSSITNENVDISKFKSKWKPYVKYYLSERTKKVSNLWTDIEGNKKGSIELKQLFKENKIFENPKPLDFIKRIITISCSPDDIILDFFAGSGTTGHAVMQLNAEDGGNRKFILVQIDEPIKEDKPAYKFCIENSLPPVISSITIERLRRAGEKIKKEIEEKNNKEGLFEENKKKIPDIGFKVFDTVEAPKLEIDSNNQILFPALTLDSISRIYNMIFTVGLDEPTQVPEEVVKDCVYRIGNNYYITNSEKVTKEQFAEYIKNGKVFIDGWTASLNDTLQNYKEDVKIVF